MSDNKCNLFAMLWDCAEFDDMEVSEKQFLEFISLRMDNNEFDQYATPTDVEVPDEDALAWYEQFKLWFAEQQES